jgi:hypothetical protein
VTTSSTAATGILPDGLEQAWRARTVELPGGHLGWTGARDHHGVPVLTHRRLRCTAARVAYLIGHAAPPVGHVKAGCEQPGCIHPDHVDDYLRRQRDRAPLRAVIGTRPRPARCRRAGHDQAVHGAIRADGRHYCHTCAHSSSR